MVIDPDFRTERGRLWFRVQLPFAWLQSYTVYASATTNGRPGRLSIYDDQDELVYLGKRRSLVAPMEWKTWDWKLGGMSFPTNSANSTQNLDVPLSPETYLPQRPARPPSPIGALCTLYSNLDECIPPTWHKLRQYVPFRMETGNRSINPGPAPAHRCETDNEEESESVQVSYVFPEDLEKITLAQQAVLDCPDITFSTTVIAKLNPVQGQIACVTGQWQLLEDHNVLWTQAVDECRTAPDSLELPFPAQFPLPPGVNPARLRLDFQAEARIECTAPAQDPPQLGQLGTASVLFDRVGRPRLDWPGCYPGWDP